MVYSEPSIHLAVTDDEIAACFDVLVQLRPDLRRHDFIARVRELEAKAGFQLACLVQDGVKSVAGFRISEWLAGGRYLEIEDLVSDGSSRSHGYGGQLFDWLVRFAASERCAHVRLVSRVQRTGAHKFYERKGMSLEAYYFSLKLGS